jgi:hypothetical protein
MEELSHKNIKFPNLEHSELIKPINSIESASNKFSISLKEIKSHLLQLVLEKELFSS